MGCMTGEEDLPKKMEKENKMYVFEVQSLRTFDIFEKDEESAFQKLLDSEDINPSDTISCIQKPKISKLLNKIRRKMVKGHDDFLRCYCINIEDWNKIVEEN
jgi:hypothetical protein